MCSETLWIIFQRKFQLHTGQNQLILSISSITQAEKLETLVDSLSLSTLVSHQILTLIHLRLYFALLLSTVLAPLIGRFLTGLPA